MVPSQLNSLGVDIIWLYGDFGIPHDLNPEIHRSFNAAGVPSAQGALSAPPARLQRSPRANSRRPRSAGIRNPWNLYM